METEKIEFKDTHSQEIFKLKSELQRIREMQSKEEEFTKVLKETPPRNVSDNLIKINAIPVIL